MQQSMRKVRVTASLARMDGGDNTRCRLWRLRLFSDGKPLKSKRFHGTYSQAKSALQAFASNAELAPLMQDATFGDYAAKWIERRERSGELAEQTLAKDRSTLARLDKAFGQTKLADMTRGAIQDGLLAIKEAKGYSGTTMQKTFVLLKQVLKSAVLDGLLPSNPMDSLTPPKNDTRERHAASVDDVKAVARMLDAMPLDGHTIGVRLMLFAGLRRGEAVGVEWRDVSGGSLHVARSVVERTRDIKTPKSAAGMRTVPLMPMLSEALESWRVQQRAQLSFLGMEQRPETPIVTNGVGRRMPAQNMWRWWMRRRGELGMDCTLHELRHTFLTMLANSGASMQSLKSIAGWSSIDMARVYVHDDEAANRDAVARMAERLDI